MVFSEKDFSFGKKYSKLSRECISRPAILVHRMAGGGRNVWHNPAGNAVGVWLVLRDLDVVGPGPQP